MMSRDDGQKQIITSLYNESGGAWHRQRGSAHSLLEKPAIYAMLPDVSNKEVLCVGCGWGEECNHISVMGPSRIVGVDISTESIQQAKQAFPHLHFQEMDMENLSFPDESFDIIFSSLAIHYVDNWSRALSEAKRVLKPGGVIVLSTHHPVCFGGLRQETDRQKEQLLGYVYDKEKGHHQMYGDYLNERWIEGSFGGVFNVTYYHKTVSGMLNEFREVGLEILDCQEPKAVPEAEQTDPPFFARHTRFPIFILFKLKVHK